MDALMLFAILFVLFEIVSIFSFGGNCMIDQLTPIGEYKKWLQDKNWFGKIYTAIAIILTIPAAIITYITFFIVFLITFIHILGTKKEKK